MHAPRSTMQSCAHPSMLRSPPSHTPCRLDGLGGLESLTRLNLSHNQLESIPSLGGPLARLHTLQVGGAASTTHSRWNHSGSLVCLGFSGIRG